MTHSFRGGLCRAVLAGALALAGLGAQAIEPGQPLPANTVAGPDGQPLTLADGQARLTYVDFWASWCGPCRQSFPWMNQLQDKYGAKGLRVLAVNLDARREDAQRFLAEHPARFALGFDPQGALARRVGVKAMPSSLLLDASGKVVAVHQGFRAEDAAELDARIAQALALARP